MSNVECGMKNEEKNQVGLYLFILHSSFDILHFGFH